MLIINVNNNYLQSQRLSWQNIKAPIKPAINNATSNVPSIPGSTTEATSTIPRSEQISDNFLIREPDNIGQENFMHHNSTT